MTAIMITVLILILFACYKFNKTRSIVNATYDDKTRIVVNVIPNDKTRRVATDMYGAKTYNTDVNIIVSKYVNNNVNNYNDDEFKNLAQFDYDTIISFPELAKTTTNPTGIINYDTAFQLTNGVKTGLNSIKA